MPFSSARVGFQVGVRHFREKAHIFALLLHCADLSLSEIIKAVAFQTAWQGDHGIRPIDVPMHAALFETTANDRFAGTFNHPG